MEKKPYFSTPKDLAPQAQNPFSYDLVYPKGGRKEKTKTVGYLDGGMAGWVTQRVGMTDKKTGELLPDSSLVMNVKKRVDNEQFVKFYTNGLAAIFELSPGAQKVLQALLCVYNGPKAFGDQIYFGYQTAVDTGYAHRRQAWKSGMNELMFREFLCPSTEGEGWYWINPTLFYRGDRLVLINEFIKAPPKGTIEVKPEKPDVVLDQRNLFSGKTLREEQAEQEQ